MTLERRRCPRLHCQALVRFSTVTGVTGAGRFRDISGSGAFLLTAVPLTPGSTLSLVILGNESASEAVERDAVVVRVATDGAGVEWTSEPSCSICSQIGCEVACPQPADDP